MGMTGSGKSTFISHCTKERVAISEPGALESCTQEVFVYKCKHFGPNANVYLVDTPGFDDTTRNDTDILKEIATWLTRQYQQKVCLSGILYLHRISDNRMGGCAYRNLSMFKKLCGDEGVKNVVFLTTFWERLDDSSVGESRELTLKNTDKFWGFFVKKGANVKRHWNNVDSALSILAKFVPVSTDERPDEMKLAIQTEMVDSHKNLDQTSAGQELQSEFKKERLKMKQEMKEREEEIKAERDQEMREILRQDQKRQAQELKRRDMEMQDLKISMERMHEEKIQQLEARLRRESRQHQKRMEEMQKKYEKDLQEIRGKRDRMEGRVKDLSRKIGNLTNRRPKKTEPLYQGCLFCVEEFTDLNELCNHVQSKHFTPSPEVAASDAESDYDGLSTVGHNGLLDTRHVVG
ncbi:hypothetical protein PENVUL_c093G04690 [Penicillium vulpinum]|uniref:C2H2-type domain-containing protein n=2 Tax=Penicillium vulpinum TaxID=29845 RepID=A0A1V6R4W5_9EURO|nr:hypothetical protein PENVUL_c093G04690 [Penicillium vulpinum]